MPLIMPKLKTRCRRPNLPKKKAHKAAEDSPKRTEKGQLYQPSTEREQLDRIYHRFSRHSSDLRISRPVTSHPNLCMGANLRLRRRGGGTKVRSRAHGKTLECIKMYSKPDHHRRQMSKTSIKIVSLITTLLLTYTCPWSCQGLNLRCRRPNLSKKKAIKSLRAPCKRPRRGSHISLQLKGNS
jgi:hypothetical protein